MKLATKKSLDLVGLGMSVMDLIQIVPEFPRADGVTQATDSQLMGGGPVPTALCAAGKLGAKAAIIDRVGDDWQGRLLHDEYERHHVLTEHLTLQSGRTTTHANVLVRERDGDRHIIFSPGNFTELSSEELPELILKDCRIFHTNGRHWPACLAAIEIAKHAGAAISFDGGAGRYEPKFDRLLDRLDILIVARDFAEKYTRSDQLEDQIAGLIRTGASIVAITDGVNGSWFATKEGEVFHQPAYSIDKVVDTTGCGDAFHGGFLYAYSKGWELQESASFASAVAAINATALGGRGHLPGLAEVRQFILNK